MNLRNPHVAEGVMPINEPTLGRIALQMAGYYMGGPLAGAVGSIAGNYLFPEKLPEISTDIAQEK